MEISSIQKSLNDSNIKMIEKTDSNEGSDIV